MKNVPAANVRFKAKKMVKPPITLSFLAAETGIHIGKLSQFIHKNLDIEQEEVDKIYAVLLKAQNGQKRQVAAAAASHCGASIKGF